MQRSRMIPHQILFLNLFHILTIVHTFHTNNYHPSFTKLSSSKLSNNEYTTLQTQQIKVTITHHIPSIKPNQLKNTWLSYVWEKGGGLPISTLLSKSKQRRLLLPSFFEEELVPDDTNLEQHNSVETLKYKMIKWGILHFDAVPNSHLGIITCKPSNNGTDFTWDVSYKVKNNYNAWNTITQFFIKQASDNLVSYLTAQEITYTCKTKFNTNASMKEVINQWMDFIWKEGGGLPLPFPPILSKTSRYMLPIFLKESIVSIDRNIITYKVDNPSILTCYPVYNHIGTVQFLKNGTVEMIWTVKVKPYPSYKNYVKTFTSAVISILSTNFQYNMQYYNQTIPSIALRLPRGTNKELVFGKLRRDGWIGNVLHGHLRDERGVMEQTLALVRPWTWGDFDDLEQCWNEELK